MTGLRGHPVLDKAAADALQSLGSAGAGAVPVRID
jgi:hypothetical protein